MVSNDFLMEKIVLKGGNAIDLVYHISGRASIDIDFSMPEDFEQDTLESIKNNIEKALQETFKKEGYAAFDIRFIINPSNIKKNDELIFWGGYRVEFKLISNELFVQKKDKLRFLRKNAAVTGLNEKKTFNIDISKYEYCYGKVPTEIDGYTVYVYTTEMLILEKIRAICQQNPEYRSIVRSHDSSGRAKDFFDIYILMESFPIDFDKESTKKTLKVIFEAKKVPLNYIHQINEQREIHRADYRSLKDTVKSDVDLKDFDYYFDYVRNILSSVEI